MLSFNTNKLNKIPMKLLIGICICLIWIPYLVASITNMEFLVTGNESLAYRFFISESAWLGNPTFIWQGHLTSIIQNFIYFLQHKFSPHTEFRLELQNFASYTIFINALLNSLIIFLIYQD